MEFKYAPIDLSLVQSVQKPRWGMFFSLFSRTIIRMRSRESIDKYTKWRNSSGESM
jgi:hypothetical protein